ncbi:MAG: hypothetical protein ACI4JC_09785 [Faecalibacterium sp.]
MEEEKVLYHSQGISEKRLKRLRISAIWFGIIALGFLVAAVIGYTIGYTHGYFEVEGESGWTVINGVAYQNMMSVEVRRYSSARDKSMSNLYLLISLLFATNCWLRIMKVKWRKKSELTLYANRLEYNEGNKKGVQKVFYPDLEKADCMTIEESIKVTRKSTNTPLVLGVAGNPEEPTRILREVILANRSS